MLETQEADLSELFLAVIFGSEAKIQAPQTKIPTNPLRSVRALLFLLFLSLSLVESYSNKVDYNIF